MVFYIATLGQETAVARTVKPSVASFEASRLPSPLSGDLEGRFAFAFELLLDLEECFSIRRLPVENCRPCGFECACREAAAAVCLCNGDLELPFTSILA